IWHVARDPVVERAVDEHTANFYLMDSALYFFAAIHRIGVPTYVPSEEDVLRARARRAPRSRRLASGWGICR
ncbi:hypothetical protein B0H10DRAFT_2058727, partial [Mycena sp. CBHHK59/15]